MHVTAAFTPMVHWVHFETDPKPVLHEVQLADPAADEVVAAHVVHVPLPSAAYLPAKHLSPCAVFEHA